MLKIEVLGPGCAKCKALEKNVGIAIEFPSRGYVRMMIREQKIARKSKDRLQADREQFDIRARRESKHR